MSEHELLGSRFGRLTVIRYAGTNKWGTRMWECLCDCGKTVLRPSGRLNNEAVRSCGCYQRDLLSAQRAIHKESHTRLHNIWLGMQNRCNNPRSPGYRLWGGKGVRVCEEWSEYVSFRDWALSSGYAENLSIDRIDVNGNYEPLNCRWATGKEQNNNRGEYNRVLEFGGKRRTLAEWADELGINHKTLYSRIVQYGWDVETALKTPVRLRRRAV